MSSVPSLDTLTRLPGEKIFCIFTNKTMNIGVKTRLGMEICNVAEVLEQVEDISLSKSVGHFPYNMCLCLFVFMYFQCNYDFFLLRYRVCSFHDQ